MDLAKTAKGFASFIYKLLPHFSKRLTEVDPEIAAAIEGEHNRQHEGIELIASENLTSQAVLDALGTELTNKYAEGYPPGKEFGNQGRYYGGCEFVDKVEKLAIDRACKLFGCKYANVQSHSGSGMNEAVYQAVLKPGDKIMGLGLNDGGHLTHGASVSSSGKIYKSVQYGVDKDTGLLDYEKIKDMAMKELPKMIVAGASAYARRINFKEFEKIAGAVTEKLQEKDPNAKCYLLVDMAHYAGLIAGKAYAPKPEELKPEEKVDDFDPIKHADFVTTTTHKSLRGPRGGIILSDRPGLTIFATKQDGSPLMKKDGSGQVTTTLAKAVDASVFPNLQGGPLMNVVAAKAVCFKEALQPEFERYAENVVTNARQLAKTLQGNGIKIVSGGTDTHLMLVDLRDKIVPGKFDKDKNSGHDIPHHLTGIEVEEALGRAGITVNHNMVPGDPNPATTTSGIRLGTPAGTTRGFGTTQFESIGEWIADIINTMQRDKPEKIDRKIKEVKEAVTAMCSTYPMYENHMQQLRKHLISGAVGHN